MRPIGTSLASAASASARSPSRASGGPSCQTFGRAAATSRSSRFFAAGSSGIISLPAYAVALQHLTHGLDHLFQWNRELRGPALAPFLMRGDRRGRLGAFDQILDLHLAFGAFIAPLDDDAGRIPAIGVFHLRLHAGRAEIDLGADVLSAQPARQHLIFADALAVAHEHDNRPDIRLCITLFDVRECGREPRHADRESGGGYALAAEARDQAVVAPAAADRAEPHRPALVVLDLEGEVHFVDRAGVIFEPANDGRVDLHSIPITQCYNQLRNFFDLAQTGFRHLRNFISFRI